jgi:FkbM family methyltransferase
MTLAATVRFIISHPLSRGRMLQNLGRFAAWQIGARLVPGPVLAEFVGGARLFAVPGLTGATGNIYVGLHEFEDMAFVLHALRPNDLFADVGANIGSFTVLASAVVGARSVCFEPASQAFEWLLSNIRINRIENLVVARREAVGAASGRIDFTQTLDSVNHVVPIDASGKRCSPNETANVAMITLDAALEGDCPRVIKIDVEGFETDVIRGAANILRNPELLAVIMELNGSGARYGHDETALRSQMHSIGFREHSYAPFERALRPLNIESDPAPGNFIFVRDAEKVRQRLEAAPSVNVWGTMV